MYTLYIDTHDKVLVLALFKDKKLVDKIMLENKRLSSKVIEHLEKLLVLNNLQVTDINEIIVIVGPGSFTGVRIGVTIAKTMAYTKNIILKPLSYLQAVALSYDKPVCLGITDRNGAFIANFDMFHQLLDDYIYVSNKDLCNYKNVLMDKEVDLDKLIKYGDKLIPVNPHLLKPLYVKKIEVEND